jgi:hypothetical protein
VRRVLAIIGVTVGLAGFLTAGSVVAATEISPQSVGVAIKSATERLRLDPEQTVERVLRVENVGGQDYDFTVAATPFGFDENYENRFDTESQWTQLARWISFEKTEFHLAVGESVDVPYRVSVPSSDVVAAGGQYAAIEVVVSDGATSGGVKITKRLMYQIYARVSGNVVERGEVVERSLPRWVFGAPYVTSYRLENHGNADFVTYGSLVVRGLFGNLVYETPSEERVRTFVWPESSPPVVELSWTGARFGVFFVTQRVEILGENHDVSSLVLIAPIWLVVVFLVGLVAGAVWVWGRLRRGRSGRRAAVKKGGKNE